MIRLLVALLLAGLVLYGFFYLCNDGDGFSEALYQQQLEQARQVETELQRKLEERMKQLDAIEAGGSVEEEEPAFLRKPPWHPQQDREITY